MDPGYSLVRRSNLRSLDDQGSWIEGLRADYPGFTLYGEGPIAHNGWWQIYENQPGRPWAGIYGGFDTFSETLTGQIWIVPEPAGWALAGLGLPAWAMLRSRRPVRTR